MGGGRVWGGVAEQLDVTSLPDKSCQRGDITQVMPCDSFPAAHGAILDVAAVTRSCRETGGEGGWGVGGGGPLLFSGNFNF